MLDNWANGQITVIDTDQKVNELRALMQEHSEGQAQMVNSEKFIGKIEREMTKFAMIQRFYLLLKKMIEWKQKRFGE